MTVSHRIEEPASAHSQRARTPLRFLPIAVVAAGLVAGYAFGWHRFLSLDFLVASRDGLIAFVAAHPFLAPAAFFVIYVLAVAFSFPAASILTIFAGFLFGWALGGAIVLVAATLGATIVFVAARTAFCDVLRDRVSGKIGRMKDLFRDNAFNTLLVLRLAPVCPFFLLNVAPAFLDVKLRTFVLATAIGIVPGTFAYAYLGEGLGSVLTAAQAAGAQVGLGDLITPKIRIAFALLAFVAAIPLVVRLVHGRRCV